MRNVLARRARADSEGGGRAPPVTLSRPRRYHGLARLVLTLSGGLLKSRAITVFGAGYVGLVTAACLASSGHEVTLLDVVDARLAALRKGQLPFHEPQLSDLVSEGATCGRLKFEHADNVNRYGDFVFVAVGTPSTVGGAADLRAVRSVVDQVANGALAGTILVMKSTVPPGTGAELARILDAVGMRYVSNPEFLREGSAVHDWWTTDRVVLGGEHDAVASVAELYSGIEAEVCKCDVTSAELIKYASNAFLATKISFANEIARLCDSVGADVTLVNHGVGLDHRIGHSFLNAGIGYGGSCFPKDTRALDFLAAINGHDFQLLKAVIDVNTRQRLLPVVTLRRELGTLRGAKIAVLGLTFKPDTDDTREAPAADIIGMLLSEGAEIAAYDPVGRMSFDSPAYVQTESIGTAARGCVATIVITEWDQITQADWPALVQSMSEPRLVFDGRNCIDPEVIRDAGGAYVGVGRSRQGSRRYSVTPQG